MTFDSNQTSFTYMGHSQLVVSDDMGRLTVFYGIDKKEGVEMRIVKTDYRRFKSLQTSPDSSFFSVVTNKSIAFWGREELKKAFDASENDLMIEVAPTRDIPQSQRVLCSTVTIIKD